MAIGDEYIDVHANMDPFDREVERGARRTSRDADGEFKRAGRDIGEVMGESASDEFGRSAPKFGRKIQEEVRHRPIRVRQKVNVDYDVDTDRLGAEIHNAVSDAFAPGGPVSRIGRKVGLAFGDAFGAGFGVSGRSALIPFIVVLVGVIVGLIVAAVQAVNALVAVLTTLPALLLGIGLQVGVLLLAFKGMGDAISKAFAAKNAKELDEALKNLTPSARAFVKTLLPLRDLFSYLKTVSQEAFFKNLGPVISEIQAALGNTLGFHLGDIAAALGRFARAFALVFASPAFVKLLDEVIPATVRWLDRFGPGFAQFLLGLIKISDASLPFLNKLGDSLSRGLEHFGQFLDRISQDKKFQKWLEDMFTTLDYVGGLFIAVTEFVASFMEALNANGGRTLILAFSDAFSLLAAFFQTREGQQAMKGFVDSLILTVIIFYDLTIAIFLAFAAVTDFIEWLTQSAIPGIGKFVSAVGGFFEDLWKALDKTRQVVPLALSIIGDAFGAIIEKIKGYWHGLQNAVMQRIANIIAAAREIPGRIVEALSDLKDRMFKLGQLAILGLLEGIKSRLGPLGALLSKIARMIASALHISVGADATSPTDEQGKKVAQGIPKTAIGSMDAPSLRSIDSNSTTVITFGPGSVSVGFQGALPTPEQARVTGAAAGQGILGQLALRDTRLAVRTL